MSLIIYEPFRPFQPQRDFLLPDLLWKVFCVPVSIVQGLEKFISFPPQLHKFNNNDWSLFHGGGRRGFCFLWRLAVWGRAWAIRSDTVLTDALQAFLMGQHFHLCFPNVWWMVLIVFVCMWWYPRGRLTWPSLSCLIIWELLWAFFWLLSSWWVDVQQSQPFHILTQFPEFWHSITVLLLKRVVILSTHLALSWITNWPCEGKNVIIWVKTKSLVSAMILF